MTTRPLRPHLINGQLIGESRVLDMNRTKELAALADSIAERADRMADRILQRGAEVPPSTEVRSFGRQAAYAEGVRDVLLWLAGDRPADLLTDILDVDPEA